MNLLHLFRKNKEYSKAVTLSVVFAIVCIAGIFFLRQSETDEKKVLITESDHVFGSLDAPVKIVEYAETECVYCKKLHPLLMRIVQEYDGKVALIYRHFPLPVHPKSFIEARALECVSELSSAKFFWEYLSMIFAATPSDNGFDLSLLPVIAERLGIQQKDFNACLESGRHADRVQEDIASGFALGVDSVPQLFVVAPNNHVFVFTNSPSYTALQATIDTALTLTE